MMKKYKRSGKAPCRICRKWFCPNNRLGKRQKTCGNPECQRKWHAKKCAQWNKNNSHYFKENYLTKKIFAAKNPRNSGENNNGSAPRPLTALKLPRKYVQEVIGLETLVIIEYFGQLLLNRVQEVIMV